RHTRSKRDWSSDVCSSDLGDVAVPGSLQSIGNRAFFKCEGLTSITLPKSLHSIGNSAFCGCKGLKSVTLPEGLQCIEWNAFSGRSEERRVGKECRGGGGRE